MLTIAFIILFFSPWTWRLFQNGNYFALVEIFVLTFILSKKHWLWVTFLFIPLSLILIKPTSTIFSFKPGELFSLNERRGEYPHPLIGKIFENKISQYFYHYQTNIFYGLDINYYFFGSHPRERAGYSEFNRLPWWLLPFFILGVYWQVKHRQYELIIYFLITLLTISFFNTDIYSFLLLPFFSLSTSLCLNYF